MFRAASAIRSVPQLAEGEVITTSAPRSSSTEAMSRLSVATTTRSASVERIA